MENYCVCLVPTQVRCTGLELQLRWLFVLSWKFLQAPQRQQLSTNTGIYFPLSLMLFNHWGCFKIDDIKFMAVLTPTDLLSSKEGPLHLHLILQKAINRHLYLPNKKALSSQQKGTKLTIRNSIN